MGERLKVPTGLHMHICAPAFTHNKILQEKINVTYCIRNTQTQKSSKPLQKKIRVVYYIGDAQTQKVKRRQIDELLFHFYLCLTEPHFIVNQTLTV